MSATTSPEKARVDAWLTANHFFPTERYEKNTKTERESSCLLSKVDEWLLALDVWLRFWFCSGSGSPAISATRRPDDFNFFVVHRWRDQSSRQRPPSFPQWSSHVKTFSSTPKHPIALAQVCLATQIPQTT